MDDDGMGRREEEKRERERRKHQTPRGRYGRQQVGQSE
jgi:hypothetical protein